MAGFSELIPVGRKFTSQGRTITEGEFALLTNLTWMTNEIHTNREFGKKCRFGDVILGGPLVLSILLPLVAMTSGLRNYLYQDGLIPPPILLGLSDIKFKAPVKPGDTLVAHAEILNIRLSTKNPKVAVVLLRVEGFNQHGEVVAEVTQIERLELAS